jgi:two-component system sensor histidine kinase PhoQ
MMSLNKRMILSASFVLAIFIVLTALGLDRAFYDSARSARQERLLGQLYLLIAAAEVDEQGHLNLPANLSEARFSLPGSGLYAFVSDRDGRRVWNSVSALGVTAPYASKLAAGDKRFEQRGTQSGDDYFVQSLGVNWAVARKHYAFTFSVSEDLTEFKAQIRHYRQSLWGWLAALAILLILAQAAVLRWGLRPLRGVAHELNAIESGRQEKLQGDYPKEIKRLTDNLNSLIHHERAQQFRYRNALGDLAHSLKTPLAVMRGALSADKTSLPATVEEQVKHMDGIVAYQLQRAATAGSSKLVATPIAILPIAEKVIAALHKVHHEKGVSTKLLIPSEAIFSGDEGDLMELLGNLLDNAFKWCSKNVQLRVLTPPGHLRLSVEDDGPGIAPEQGKNILQRGVRADEMVPGHGIGLAIVRDITEAYAGSVEAGRSQLGGAAITLDFLTR